MLERRKFYSRELPESGALAGAYVHDDRVTEVNEILRSGAGGLVKTN